MRLARPARIRFAGQRLPYHQNARTRRRAAIAANAVQIRLCVKTVIARLAQSRGTSGRICKAGKSKTRDRSDTQFVAEREGFEPPIRLPVCRISSAVLSTTQPPLPGRGLSPRRSHRYVLSACGRDKCRGMPLGMPLGTDCRRRAFSWLGACGTFTKSEDAMRQPLISSAVLLTVISGGLIAPNSIGGRAG